jgi:hypothetical protein
MLSQVLDIDMVQVDVSATVGPRVGLECHAAWAPDPSATVPGWKSLLDRLVGLGVCSERQRDAVAGWPGLTPLIHEGMVWPITASSAPLPPLAWGIVVRRISHLKISIDAHGVLEAKAYLLGQSWRAPSVR